MPHQPHTNDAPRWGHHLVLRATVGALALEASLALTRDWSVIFGPSGSGKSTILRVVAGLLPGAQGQLLRRDLDGREHDLTHTPARDRRIAYAPQQPSLFPHLTVAENIAFAQRLSQSKRASRQPPPAPNAIEQATKLFRLDDLLRRYPNNLSGGQQQLVNLARAFCVPAPRLILLDEPFTGIDRPLRDAILPELREFLRPSGVPVLSVTHDVEEAFLLDAEIFRIDAGRLLDHGDVSTVLAAERLSILDALR